MRVTLIQLSAFSAKWSKLGLSDDDLRALESSFIENPAEDSIRSAESTYGQAWRRSGDLCTYRGSRGDLPFYVYGKNEQSALSADEKKIFRQVLERLRKYHQS